MIKINYNITKEEKSEILQKHINATKKHYLLEENDVFGKCFDNFKIDVGLIKKISRPTDSIQIRITFPKTDNFPEETQRYSFYPDKSYKNYVSDPNNNNKLTKIKREGNWYCINNQLYLKKDDIWNKVGDGFKFEKVPNFQIPNDSNEPQPATTATTVSSTPPPQTPSVNKPTFKQDDDGEYSYGSINRMIIDLQNVLNLMGKTDFDGKKLDPDGKFGKRTLSALKKLDRYSYFKETDKITVDDIEKIIKDYKDSQGQTTQSTGPTPTRVGTQSDSTTGQSTSTPDTSTTGLEVTFDEL